MADEMVLQAQRFFNSTYSGYSGTPTPNDRVKSAVSDLKADMDARTTIASGTDTVRSIRQWMKSRHIDRADFSPSRFSRPQGTFAAAATDDGRGVAGAGDITRAVSETR
ncbi:hypothetical protein [Streptomyces sp. NPDC057238]|uniref:hypothetical protein n=1 Tax=Streptomyces sp. NPDC057238 TaxID=3346060 RepID=UPI00362C63AE